MEKESKKMVDEAVTSTIASLKRKAFIHDSDSDDDMPLSSKLKISKEVADTTTASLVDSLKPKKRKRLIKSRYHIPLKVQNQGTDPDDLSHPDESSNPDGLSNPDGISNTDEASNPDGGSNPVASTLDGSPKNVAISDSPAPPTPGRRHINMSYERVTKIAAELGLAVPGQKR